MIRSSGKFFSLKEHAGKVPRKSAQENKYKCLRSTGVLGLARTLSIGSHDGNMFRLKPPSTKGDRHDAPGGRLLESSTLGQGQNGLTGEEKPAFQDGVLWHPVRLWQPVPSTTTEIKNRQFGSHMKEKMSQK